MIPSVVIHGHFYQPPREDPWTEEIEEQPSAAPFHDWNERVHAECYRSVVAARIPGKGGRIREITNTLASISFNFGPTLLEWMEREAPRTYGEILEADRLSRKANGGFGNAIAQAYHHLILPLASRRDKVTEVRWGIEDFRRRFGRDPVGMWLPETAADGETLDVLAEEGIAFTILAPHQVDPVPAGGLPGWHRTRSGRSIALFVYDGPLSHDVAFGPLPRDSGAWLSRILEAAEGGRESPPSGEEPPPPPEGSAAAPPPSSEPNGSRPAPLGLVSVATDGETYGHHHRFGEMALASLIGKIRGRADLRLENFASFLARHPPVEEVRLVEPTSWSCAHGVERWRGNCGCKMDPGMETQQEWRAGLRKAQEWLAEELHSFYEAGTRALRGDPWETRNEYGRVIAGQEDQADFLDRRLPRSHSREDRTRTAELLEMERNTLRLFTSCGWFFDDLAGIEPVQILRYAARALDLAGTEGRSLEGEYLSLLREAVSNEDPPRDGATIYLQEAKPKTPPPARVAGGVAALRREALEVPPLPGFRTKAAAGEDVGIEEVNTGREWVFAATVAGQVPGTLEVQVREVSSTGDSPRSGAAGEYLLGLEDLVEAHRSPLEGLVLQEALERWVPPGDTAGLLSGKFTLAEVLGRALILAVRALEAGPGDDLPESGDVERVEALALLLNGRNLPIPFDAQTDFYRIWKGSSPLQQARLQQLRGPMGFVTDS